MIARDRDPCRLAVVDRLLKEFGSAAPALIGSAPRFRRAGVPENIIEDLAAFRAAAVHLLRERAYQRPIIEGWRKLIDYLHVDLAYRHCEQLRVLHLDTQNALIVEDVVSEGTVDEAPGHIREIIARALEVGAASIILVHNHPSGNPGPSRSDVKFTLALIAAAKTFRIAVHDHLIIGRNGHTSLRATGLL